MNFRLRRILGTSLLALSVFFIYGWLCSVEHSLLRVSHHSGWLLAGGVVFLAIYNLRKKITYPPFLKSSTWLQFHIYVAWLVVILFLFHTGFRLPNGRFEVSMALVFWGVALSGVVGLLLSRFLPNRMRLRGDEVIYERIPIYQRQVRMDAEELLVKLVQQVDANTLPDFYTSRLQDFFYRPHRLWKQFFQPGATRKQILSELNSLKRYLNDKEEHVADQLADLIQTKDNLDYHLVRQGALKFWLFVHIPLTYILFVFIFIHVLLVHAFYGGS